MVNKPPYKNRTYIVSLIIIMVTILASGYLIIFQGWQLAYNSKLPSEEFGLQKVVIKKNGSSPILAAANKKYKQTNQIAIFKSKFENDLFGEYDSSKLIIADNSKDLILNQTIMPGLATTRSYNFWDEKAGTSQGMIPQGIAVTNQYLFISAYDGDYEVNSVIYMVNRKTNKLIKTIVLQGQPHVGGIAWDSNNNQLWVCGRRHRQAEVFAISLKKIKAYNFEKVQEPIQYASRAVLKNIARASFVTYNDGALFVGFFNQYGKGNIQKYNLSKTGNLAGVVSKTQFGSDLDTVSKSLFRQKTVSMIQGMTFYKGYILLSQSFSWKDSKLLVFKYDEHLASYRKKDALLILDMPPMMEQITMDGNNLLTVHESGGFEYRSKYGTGVDRVIAYNLATIDKLIKEGEKNE